MFAVSSATSFIQFRSAADPHFATKNIGAESAPMPRKKKGSGLSSAADQRKAKQKRDNAEAKAVAEEQAAADAAAEAKAAAEADAAADAKPAAARAPLAKAEAKVPASEVPLAKGIIIIIVMLLESIAS